MCIFALSSQLLITYFTFVWFFLGKIGIKYGITSFEKAYGSFRRRLLYIFFIEFGIPLKRVKLVKMNINKVYDGPEEENICLTTFCIMNG
jgi:hypothetical protein